MSQYKCRERLIRETIDEARRFIKRAEETLTIMDKVTFYAGGRENAAMKRASLDHSILLQRIRKPVQC